MIVDCLEADGSRSIRQLTVLTYLRAREALFHPNLHVPLIAAPNHIPRQLVTSFLIIIRTIVRGATNICLNQFL